MSSCLSGGGRAYGFDLEIVKSPSTSTITSHSSSPSSTLSESSNSPLAISTRKPRTPRKRPNQTYSEAAAILSTAYPKLFSAKHLTKPFKLAKPHESFLDEPSVLLLPFRVFENSSFLLHHPIPEKPNSTMEPRIVNSCEKFCHGQMAVNPLSLCNGYQDDFDAGSILDEEMEEGGNCIDSIMGNLSVNNDSVGEPTYWYGSVFPGKFDVGRFGLRNGVRALRQVEDGDWWRFSTVNVGDISPRLRKRPPPVEKKKKKIEEIKSVESAKEFSPAVPENSVPKSNPGLLLKLNVEEVVNAWSDRGSPFSEEFPGQETASGNDLHARLAQVELFPDNGGVREASVLRYKEKRRSRLFSKKIRYQVRKVNADRRPRMKVLISGKEELDALLSPAMDAVIRVFKRVSGLPESEGDAKATGVAFCSIRLLVASTQAISLIGKQGSLIKSIQESTGASVRVLSSDELPYYANSDERIVELQGEALKVLKALEAVVGHLRKFLVDHSILPLFEKSHPTVSQEHQVETWADKSSLHGASQTGIAADYPLPGKRDSLYLDRESQLEPHIPASGLSLYSQDPGLSGMRSSGLGRAAGPIVTQIAQTMQIPLSYAEDIIGIGGANIAYIRRTSGAILTVQESRGLPDEITVEIKGTSSQVQTAQQLIQEFISSHKEPVSSSYGKMDGGLRSSYSQIGNSTYSSSSLSSQPYGGYGSSGLGGYGSSYRL